MNIQMLDGHLCTQGEILGFLKANETVWTAKARAEVDKAVRACQEGSEEQLLRMIEEDLWSDSELHMVPYMAVVGNSDHSWITSVMTIPLTCGEPDPVTGVWKGTFAFLVQGESLMAIVRDVEVITLKLQDEVQGDTVIEARHADRIKAEQL